MNPPSTASMLSDFNSLEDSSKFSDFNFQNYMESIPEAKESKKKYLNERFKAYKYFFALPEETEYNADFEEKYLQLAQQLLKDLENNKKMFAEYKEMKEHFEKLQRLVEPLNLKISEDDEDSDPYALFKKSSDLLKSFAALPIYLEKYFDESDSKSLLIYCDLFKTYFAAVFEGWKGFWSLRLVYRLMEKLHKGEATQFKTKLTYHAIKLGQLGLAVGLTCGVVSLPVLLCAGVLASGFLLYKAHYILSQTQRDIAETTKKIESLKTVDDSFALAQRAYLQSHLKELKKTEYYQKRKCYRAAGTLLASILSVVGLFIPPAGLVAFAIMCYITYSTIKDLKQKKVIYEKEEETSTEKWNLYRLFSTPAENDAKQVDSPAVSRMGMAASAA